MQIIRQETTEASMRIGTATALVAALLATAPVAHAQAQERCYGVARAERNDGLDRREAPGGSTVDFQGNAWVTVPAGTCLTMALPVQPDGTPRRGSLEPLDRDRP
jgi:uncharacterized membrane protein